MCGGYRAAVIDDPYRDADLVQLYDLDNPGGEDHAYYRALADELGARSVVDLGCGTGLLTRSLAGPGRTVLGVDPSRTMLDFARSQPGRDAVTWVFGDATALPPAGTADLAVCTGNAIMHLAPDELPATLTALAGALRPGGVFAFETRNPAHREWERWTPEATYGERISQVGQLREWLDVTEVADGRVTFDAHNVFPDGEDRVYTSVLYFRTAEQFRRELESAGFTDVTCDGDWRGGPVEDGSRLLVFRARRPEPRGDGEMTPSGVRGAAPHIRPLWTVTPLEGVGPLRFGMTAAQAVAALPEAREVRRFQADPYNLEVVGIELAFQPAAPALYEYFDKAGRLFCVAADAVHGPRMVLDGTELTGGDPGELELWLSERSDAMGGLRFGPLGNPGIEELGLVLRAQDTAVGLLTRPVLVGRDRADRCVDNSESAIPECEWVGHVWPGLWMTDETRWWPSATYPASWAGKWSPPF